MAKDGIGGRSGVLAKGVFAMKRMTVTFFLIGLLSLGFFPAHIHGGGTWMAMASDTHGDDSAGSVASASQFLRAYSQQALKAFSHPNLTDAEAKEHFRILYRQGFSNDSISRFVLGRYWRAANPEQRQTFETLYENYLVQSYTDEFRRFTGNFMIISGREGSAKNVYIITSEVRFPESDQPTKVEWRLGFSKGSYRIYDIIVEGVSLAVTQRSEFTSVVRDHNGSLDALFKQLRQKIKKSKAAFLFAPSPLGAAIS